MNINILKLLNLYIFLTLIIILKHILIYLKFNVTTFNLD